MQLATRNSQLATRLILLFLMASAVPLFLIGQKANPSEASDNISNLLPFGTAFPIVEDQQIVAYATINAESYSSLVGSRLMLISDGGHEIEGLLHDRSTVKFSALRPYTAYTLVLDDMRGKRIELSKLQSVTRSGELLTVSQEMFNFLRFSDAKDTDAAQFVQLLMEQGDVSDYEKAHFVQNHVLKGEPVKNYLFFENYDFTKVLKTGECNCTGVVTLPSVRVVPGGIINNSNSNVGWVTNYEQNPIPSQNAGDGVYGNINKAEFFLESLGPAKTWTIYSDGAREEKNEWFGATVGSDMTETQPLVQDDINTNLGQYMYNSFLLFCNGGAFESRCKCKKDIRVRWLYESQIDVRAQNGSLGNGTKRSVAIGEDVAIAFALEESPTVGGAPILTVAGSLRNLRSATCNQEPNDVFSTSLGQFIGSVVLLGASIAVFGVPITGATTSAQQAALVAAQGQLAGQVIAGTSGILGNEPNIQNNANCGTSIQNVPNAIFEDRRFQLKPNRALNVAIVAGSRVVSRGMRSWQSEVSLRSNFFIAAHQPTSKESGSDDAGCCFPSQVGTYWSKSIAPNNLFNSITTFDPVGTPLSYFPPSSQQELGESIANFFNFYSGGFSTFNLPTSSSGNYTVRGEIGYLVGKIQATDCLLRPFPGVPFPMDPIVGGSGNARSSSSASSREVAPGFQQLDLFDMAGKKITSIQIAPPEEADDVLAWQLLIKRKLLGDGISAKLPAEMYLARHQNPDRFSPSAVSTIKIILP